MREFVQRWIVTTVAVLAAAHVVRGIDYDGLGALLAASLLLGVLNAFLRPVMIFLSLPLLILTLGLFTLVINGVLLYLVGRIVKGFHVASFGAAFWGALTISVVSLLANLMTGTGKARVEVRRSRKPGKAPGRGEDHGSGPVIDV